MPSRVTCTSQRANHENGTFHRKLEPCEFGSIANPKARHTLWEGAKTAAQPTSKSIEVKVLLYKSGNDHQHTTLYARLHLFGDSLVWARLQLANVER